jgi:hypothetical protein
LRSPTDPPGPAPRRWFPLWLLPWPLPWLLPWPVRLRPGGPPRSRDPGVAPALRGEPGRSPSVRAGRSSRFRSDPGAWPPRPPREVEPPVDAPGDLLARFVPPAPGGGRREELPEPPAPRGRGEPEGLLVAMGTIVSVPLRGSVPLAGRSPITRAYTRQHPPLSGGCCLEKSRRRPTLPGGYPPSTIGAGGLNCRVRNGNGCLSAAMATGNCALSGARGPSTTRVDVRARGDRSVTPERSIASTSKFPSPRPISTGQLNALPHVHFRPINVVVWPRALPG